MNISVSRLPYYRMVGYMVTILMHTVNTYVMIGNFKDDVMEDPNIQLFSKFMYKFITCWTFGAQIVHATLGLSYDLLTLTIGDQYKFLKRVKQVRDLMFASIVVPLSFLVATCFWPIFLYDRELILPYYTTKIVGTISNHIMHTAIVPVTLWELVFQARQAPSSHKQNISVMMGFAGGYLVVIFSTFFELGVFPYPIMTMLYGSIFFVVFMLVTLLLLPMYYFGQWHVSRLLWSERLKKDC